MSEVDAAFVTSVIPAIRTQRGHVSLSHRRVLLCLHGGPTTSRSTPSPTRRSVLKRIIVSAASVSLSTLSSQLGLTQQMPKTLAEPSSSPHRVYLDVSVAGRPRGRITVQLFSSDAPSCATSFEELAIGTLRNRSGRTAGYRYSQGTRVFPGQRVYLGRLNQIDSVNQSPGTPQRQQRLVEFPTNSDTNQLSHDRPGLLSMEKGGSFEFSITAKPDATLDDSNVVIGEVINGMDVVEALVNVPIIRKTIRDGYRNIGKAIGDARANVQLENKPLQKILITDCGVLEQ